MATILALTALACGNGRNEEADRIAIADLSARWNTAVASRSPTLPNLVSEASTAHYRKLKVFALHANTSTLQRLHPTDQLQALFMRCMLGATELQAMPPNAILVFAVEQGMIGSDLRRSDELREVTVNGNSGQGRLYKFGRNDRADRSMQYFEFEDGRWRVDLRGELERLRNDFDAFVARSQLTPEEAAFFILEARLFRKVVPANLIAPLGETAESPLSGSLVEAYTEKDVVLRVVAIRESLDDPNQHAAVIEDRRRSLRHVLGLGDPVPLAPEFVLRGIQGDLVQLRTRNELLTLRIEQYGVPLNQRVTDGPHANDSSRVSLLRQAQFGANREGLMAQ